MSDTQSVPCVAPAGLAAPDAASTTEIGNAFRDLVCDLLRTKYADLRIEKRLSGTKVDIRFTSEGLARELWAVECKDYGKPLDKYVSSSIFSLYHPMLEKREVDRVLIVSRKGLTKTRRSMWTACEASRTRPTTNWPKRSWA